MGPMQLVGALYNWTDDLPKCDLSGIGYQTNQDYSMGDDFVGVDRYEDRSFHFQCPDECYLYGVIDGHDGAKASSFAAQKLPAELLLGQLKDDFTDEDVKKQLHESFDCLAKAFIEDLINDSLMEKIKLEQHLEGVDRQEALHKYPTLFKDLEKLDKEISGGCSAVIGLVHKSKLFIANVGDTRALLCRADDSGELGLIQLSVDHTISTVAELQRLANLGIDIEKLQYSGYLDTTRSIGDWEFKGGYKNNDVLRHAESEPVLSTPSIHGGEKIDNSMKFLILMSAGVYKAYEEATGTKPNMVNNNITSMVHQEINKQTSVDAVAQAVIDEIGTLHYDQYRKSNKQRCTKRGDMTLLVRLFNIELGGKQEKSSSSVLPASKLLQKSAKLAPLKIPEARIPDPKKSADHDSPSSTGSNTPTSTAINEVKSTSPGSAGSGSNESMSPQFSQPLGYPYVSPLTSTVIRNTNYQPLQVEVEEQFKAANARPDYRMKGRGNPDKKHNCESPQMPYVLKRSGLYHPRPIQRDAGNSINSPSPEGLKTTSADALLMVTDQEIDYGDVYDSTKSNNSSVGRQNEDKTRLFNRPPEPLETDQDGRIKPYVDFTDFNNKINEMGGEEAVFGELMSILK